MWQTGFARRDMLFLRICNMCLMMKSLNVDLQISVHKPSCVTGKHLSWMIYLYIMRCLIILKFHYNIHFQYQLKRQFPTSHPFTLQKSDTEICSSHIFCVLLIPWCAWLKNYISNSCQFQLTNWSLLDYKTIMWTDNGLQLQTIDPILLFQCSCDFQDVTSNTCDVVMWLLFNAQKTLPTNLVTIRVYKYV